MILNAKNNNFIISFAKPLFYPEIEQKYTSYIKRIPMPYETLHDYISASVQGVSFPALKAEFVEQLVMEDPYATKGAFRLERYLEREFTITFKLYEGFINYWILFDQFRAFYALDNKDQFMSDVFITFLDQQGFELISVHLHQILWLSLSELELNYSSNVPEFKTFTLNCQYNYINIKKRLD